MVGRPRCPADTGLFKCVLNNLLWQVVISQQFNAVDRLVTVDGCCLHVDCCCYLGPALCAPCCCCLLISVGFYIMELISVMCLWWIFFSEECLYIIISCGSFSYITHRHVITRWTQCRLQIYSSLLQIYSSLNCTRPTTLNSQSVSPTHRFTDVPRWQFIELQLPHISTVLYKPETMA